MNKKCVIVDVDGTIANLDHRLHFYMENKNKNWEKFIEAAKDDAPYGDILFLVQAIEYFGASILIVTARSEKERDMTVKWLHDVAGLENMYKKLYMREAGDYRDDAIVKREILDQIILDGYDPILALEDRDHVVQMWRDAGITCLQVKNGDY